MIKIIDYGLGNIQAFMTMFKRMGIPVERAKTVSDLENATKLILPGVGAFDHAMTSLNASGLRPMLEEMILRREVPVLGVCVGMQMLANSSEEGDLPGLGWIPGKVCAFSNNPACHDLPMPHMGWNDLQVKFESPLFSSGDSEPPQFYFLHSYYFNADDKKDVVATAGYGFDFDAIVKRKNIIGVQCHPEKSHHWGGQLLKNFSEL